MSQSWDREAPQGAVEIAWDDDQFLTVDKWPREAFKEHYHEDFNWLVPMRPGRVVVVVEGREMALDGNQWICIFPRTPHAVTHVSDDCEVLSLFIAPQIMRTAIHRMNPQPTLGDPFILGGKGSIAQGLALEWAEQRFTGRPRDAVDESFVEFLSGWLWRSYECRSEEAGTLALRLRLRLGGSIGEAVANFLESHLGDSPFPWGALAERIGLSQRTLQRQFMESIGLSPTEVLARLRVDRAKDLLRDPSLRLGDVAMACGYASQSHFSTAFKAATGLAPGRYRQSDQSELSGASDSGAVFRS